MTASSIFFDPNRKVYLKVVERNIPPEVKGRMTGIDSFATPLVPIYKDSSTTRYDLPTGVGFYNPMPLISPATRESYYTINSRGKKNTLNSIA